ncbi:histidinol-phosphate transaminase [Pseudodesulfovibrio sp. zrk46]|uniref:pyridoxal phosphate-dependent aminotransferase n=1 Tax=Pseudodesulfovibrio sp. zrk46 TaxID=2725288 RepID=UPI001448AC48|nr:histidinol-phosphate transaminase [Pseudodesulfovibrio sp. zrk46]QJB56458.1 histidinol-phosphate aminotransferase family protein [Pseudodesulfovibrio sp. zrk46]
MRNTRYLSNFTLKAMSVGSGDYVSRDHDELAHIEMLKKKHGLETVYRFDIGKNTDGFSPRVRRELDKPDFQNGVLNLTDDYPDNHYVQLRGQLSRRYKLPPEWFAISAGLESMIDHIARSVFNPGDTYLLPVPNFSVFEDMSKRTMAHPVEVPLGDDLQWTGETVHRLIREMKQVQPRLVWISNPVNPTGQLIPKELIERVVRAAGLFGVLVVVDEAYGEYTDHDKVFVSAASMLKGNPQLVVLRTFSKMFGLPSARVGYMMSSQRELVDAVNMYRPMFPFSWFSLHLAQVAIGDEAHVRMSRRRVARRRRAFFDAVSDLADFQFLPTQVNTVMFRHTGLRAHELTDLLEEKGILTANLNGVAGIRNRGFLRMTLRSHKDNEVFVSACREVQRRVCQ